MICSWNNQDQPIEVHIGISSGMTLVGSMQFDSPPRHSMGFFRKRPTGQRSRSASRHRPIRSDPRQLSDQRSACGPNIIESAGPQRLKNIEEEIEAFRLVKRA